MKKIKELCAGCNRKKILDFFMPGIITAILVILVLICKGIWPFGRNRIDYFDNMQQVAPLYTHLWDWMHGDASLWFDWYTGLGTNVSMSISAFSMLSPFNLMLYLVPRHLILESISIMTVVKMAFMAINMNLLLKKAYPSLSNRMSYVFSLMYACSGYVVLYGSCFTPWMDIVAFFPLLILGMMNMYETGQRRRYVGIVALIFIINYYLSAMSMIFVLVFSGIYLLLRCERSVWKNHIWNLGIGTAGGIGLSAFILVPVFKQLGTSQRGSSGQSIVAQYQGWITSSILSDGATGAFQRYMMLYGLGFVLALIFFGLKKAYKNNRRDFWYYLSLSAVVLIPVFVEGTNKIWHFGSYNGYTLRMGFIISFTLIFVAAHFAGRLIEKEQFTMAEMKKPAIFAAVACVVFAVVYQLMPKINEIPAIIFYMTVLILMFIFYCRVFAKAVKNDRKVCAAALIPLIVMELFFGLFGMLGLPKFYTIEDYQVGDYVQYANSVKLNLLKDVEDSASERIINPDISLNANYPLILRHGALSSFTAALQSTTQSSAKNWGYSKYFLWLLDSGGTVFSNTMLHITQAVNQNSLDPNLWTISGSDGMYKLYENNYKLPFAMNVSQTFVNEDLGNDWISHHNAIYKALSGDSEDLVTGMSYSERNTDTTREYFSYVRDRQAVYLNIADINNLNSDANQSWLMGGMHIYVNEHEVEIPTLGNIHNSAYFTDYNNNLVYLGIFENEPVSIRIEWSDPWYKKVSTVQFAQLSMDKMQALTEQFANYRCDVTTTGDSMTIKLDGDATRNLVLVPIIPSDNWTVTVNGTVQKNTRNVTGMFTGVYVQSGENEITFTFEPAGKKLGFLITAVIALITVAGMFIHSKKNVTVPAWIKHCATFLFLELFNAVIVAVFLIPTLAAIPAFIWNVIIRLM